MKMLQQDIISVLQKIFRSESPLNAATKGMNNEAWLIHKT